MSTISMNNSMNTISARYISTSSNESEISSLQEERESLQSEIQSLQQEVTSGNSIEDVETQIQILQTQVSSIDSQISTLQAEQSKKSSGTEKVSTNNIEVKIPAEELDNPETLNNTLSILEKTSKALEYSMIGERVNGTNTENKAGLLNNMKSNIDEISSKIKEEDRNKDSVNENNSLIGNFLNTQV